MNLLTEKDGAIFYEARVLLSDLRDRAAKSVGDANGLHEAANLGRLTQACATAEDAVFDALNCAISYLDDPIADASHKRWMVR